MAYDYDKLYGETKNALGVPTRAFVEFFDAFGRARANVLDIGCGQGRDALFIARRGHRVTGVDISPNGIRDLTEAAEIETLDVEAVVADINDYQPPGRFDVVLVDRTLHMLRPDDRLRVLRGLLKAVDAAGYLLIADEPRNIPDFANVVAEDERDWAVVLKERGIFFIQAA